jgi:hypothetical protein
MVLGVTKESLIEKSFCHDQKHLIGLCTAKSTLDPAGVYNGLAKANRWHLHAMTSLTRQN